MNIFRFARVWLFAAMLLMSSANSIRGAEDRSTAGSDNLYNYYDCTVSEYICRPSTRGQGLKFEA